MSKTMIFLMILAIFSSNNRNRESLDHNNKYSIYELIKNDLLKSSSFLEYKKANNITCNNLKFSKWDQSFCYFNNTFNNSIPDNGLKFCDENQKEFSQKKIKGINKLNDSGESCFLVSFTDIVEDMLIVEINTKKNPNKGLLILYDINEKESKVRQVNYTEMLR